MDLDGCSHTPHQLCKSQLYHFACGVDLLIHIHPAKHQVNIEQKLMEQSYELRIIKCFYKTGKFHQRLSLEYLCDSLCLKDCNEINYN